MDKVTEAEGRELYAKLEAVAQRKPENCEACRTEAIWYGGRPDADLVADLFNVTKE